MSCKINNCPNLIIQRGKYCELHRTSRKLCVESGCKTSARGKSDKCIAHGGGVRCVEPGCNTGAATKSDKCKAHGGGAMCIEPGCKKSARSKTNQCKAHGGGVRCVEPGCKKSAVDKSNKCIAHGGGKRCIEPECNKSAQGKSNTCIAHGGGARCVEPECNKSARAKSDKCIEHGGGPICIESGCKKSARYKSDKCKSHGGGIRCVEPGCKKSAVDKSNKCTAHGGGMRCPHCINWIDSRSGSNKYDGYCATCFKRVFPEDPRSTIIYEHTKEIRVRNAITEASHINPLFQGFVHDQSLYTGHCDCTHRRRVDHRKLIGNTMIAIETDEYAHRSYDEKDEEIRYDDLYMIYSGKWIFIRFNPDTTMTQKSDIEDRIIVLLNVIENQIERIRLEENQDLVEIIKLFY